MPPVAAATSNKCKTVRSCTALSRRLGRPFLLLVADADRQGHAVIVDADGLVIDNEHRIGISGSHHPWARSTVLHAFGWEAPPTISANQPERGTSPLPPNHSRCALVQMHRASPFTEAQATRRSGVLTPAFPANPLLSTGRR
jgi:hypothetical protein